MSDKHEQFVEWLVERDTAQRLAGARDFARMAARGIRNDGPASGAVFAAAMTTLAALPDDELSALIDGGKT